MISFLGDSFAAHHLREAARNKGLSIVSPEEAEVIFISQDADIEPDGTRGLDLVEAYINEAKMYGAILVLTSQVPPGFTRSLGMDIYHQAETLRVKDAEKRAMNPDYIVVGCEHPERYLPLPYYEYVKAFQCPLIKVTWEEAEFSKIAVNMTLASQVDNANFLSEIANKVGADWDRIREVLSHDKRIGKYSYLQPGHWQDSPHLLRDYVTIREIQDDK